MVFLDLGPSARAAYLHVARASGVREACLRAIRHAGIDKNNAPVRTFFSGSCDVREPPSLHASTAVASSLQGRLGIGSASHRQRVHATAWASGLGAEGFVVARARLLCAPSPSFVISLSVAPVPS